ncbi:S1 family peptidase [Streptomyces sp. NPDC058193]|uniref:S1 family peptidase n=1 Tax=Streptomyces sp. NPDC058193 TaxID=3346373 RepID=UPI0036F0B0FC
MGSLLAVFALPAGQATAAAEPLTDPARLVALAAGLGDDRTAGVHYEDGRPVLAVTDQAAAETVRVAGGTAEIVAHSQSELDTAQADLNTLAGIPNTAWGVDPSSNKISVDIHDGVSDADRTRIEKIAEAHGDAVSITKRQGALEKSAYEMRGGLGITSSNRICSAAFNVTDDAGNRYMLTAGHCMVGGYYDWNRRTGNVPLGRVTHWQSEPGDWAIVAHSNPNVIAYGVVQYRDGSESQITNSRPAVDGEKVKRVGTMSQDLDGMVLEPSTTVNYDDGSTYYNMIKTSLCNVAGDSGGGMFTGTTALGITSGGNYVDQPCGNTDGQSDRVTFYQPVYKAIIPYDLKVY